MNDLNNEAINMECVSTYIPLEADSTTKCLQTITKRNKCRQISDSSVNIIAIQIKSHKIPSIINT